MLTKADEKRKKRKIREFNLSPQEGPETSGKNSVE